jgi:hypothetical protein
MVKVCPRTGHEGPDREQRYITISLTSALEEEEEEEGGCSG